MNLTNNSCIIIVDQAKKKVVGFVKEILFTIVDIKVSEDLIVIDALRVTLLVRID